MDCLKKDNNKIYKILLVVTAALTMSACAISPESITDNARSQRIKQDMIDLYQGQEAVSGPISLSEAIARALKYNLDQRVKLMERAVATGSLEVSRFDLLPKLVLNAGYNDRSNDAGAISQSLISGSQSLEASTSQERRRNTFSSNLAWNVLDFGVSYANAKQISDQVNISNEMRRKIIQNIVSDVHTLWWRVVVADKMTIEIDTILSEAREAINRSRELEKKKIEKPMDALQRQRSLLELIDRMSELRKEMSHSKLELANIMNLKPATKYTVLVTDEQEIPEYRFDINKLETVALASRPEIREEDYRKRISTLEVRKALLRMFPGLEISTGRNYDSNKFSFNNTWSTVGVQVSWNIFNLFSGHAAQKQAETQVDLANIRRLALSAAILTQVHLTWQRYLETKEDYWLASELSDVENRISDNVAAAKKANRVGMSDVIMSRASAVAGRLRQGLAYADLRGSISKIHNVLGTDPLPDEVNGRDVSTLAKAIKQHLNKQTSSLLSKAAKQDPNKAETKSVKNIKEKPKPKDNQLDESVVGKILDNHQVSLEYTTVEPIALESSH